MGANTREFAQMLRPRASAGGASSRLPADGSTTPKHGQGGPCPSTLRVASGNRTPPAHAPALEGQAPACLDDAPGISKANSGGGSDFKRKWPQISANDRESSARSHPTRRLPTPVGRICNPPIHKPGRSIRPRPPHPAECNSALLLPGPRPHSKVSRLSLHPRPATLCVIVTPEEGSPLAFSPRIGLSASSRSLPFPTQRRPAALAQDLLPSHLLPALRAVFR